MDGLTDFMRVSERLTGHDHTELLGTDSANDYLQTLRRAVPEDVLQDLLAVADNADSHAATTELLEDQRLGPVAKNLVVLWYCGTWQELDNAWRQNYEAPAVDTHVVSANAYLSGLQWTVAEAHAPGGNVQGFGAWASPPDQQAEGQRS